MNILKREKENNFFFIFCGENKGNYKYINSLIKNNLGIFVKNFQFLNDNEVVAIYLNLMLLLCQLIVVQLIYQFMSLFILKNNFLL